jgi:hypothetical protein
LCFVEKNSKSGINLVIYTLAASLKKDICAKMRITKTDKYD